MTLLSHSAAASVLPPEFNAPNINRGQGRARRTINRGQGPPHHATAKADSMDRTAGRWAPTA